jgi:hypothetical protein
VDSMRAEPVGMARKKAARVLECGFPPPVANLRQGAVMAKLGIVWSFREKRQKQPLSRARTAGIQMRERKLALIGIVWLQGVIV